MNRDTRDDIDLGIRCTDPACPWERRIEPKTVEGRTMAQFREAAALHAHQAGHGTTYPARTREDAPTLSETEAAIGVAYDAGMQAGRVAMRRGIMSAVEKVRA